MKRYTILILVLTIFLCACGAPASPTTEASIPETTIPEATTPETTIPETTIPETTVPETTVPPTTVPTEPPHSYLYREDIPLEQVLTYFQEVTAQTEYSTGDGNPALIQKWLYPILLEIQGEPTERDLEILENFFEQLNQIPGFPGIAMAVDLQQPNLTISFLTSQIFHEQFDDFIQGEDAWGAAQYWYFDDTNEIYSGRIGYLTDIPQLDRDSILLEEIVNLLGITDTVLREDSIVYQYSNSNLELSDVDWLLLELLYHPDIQSGMNAQQCEEIIAELYH